MVPAPVPAAPSWTGCYVAAGGGYGMFNLDHDTIGEAPSVPGTPFSLDLNTGGRGYFATAAAGCDYQVTERWVIGVFGDGDWSWMSGQHVFNCPAGCAPALLGNNVGDIDLKWAWAAGARIGFVVLPRLMTYVSAGYTEARFSQVDYVTNPAGVNLGAVLPEQNYSGWFLGGGAQYALDWLGPYFYWRNEYRFSDYGTQNVSITCTTAACAGGGVVSGGPVGAVDRIHPYVHTIRSTLVFKFGG
jgi:outer membrane immunogenic protein